MTEETAAIRDALTASGAFALEEPSGKDVTASVVTTAFDATVTVAPTARGCGVSVTVTVPTLRAAVRDGEVGSALLEGWREAFERRLVDAPGAIRGGVDIDDQAVESEGGRLHVTYEYTTGDAERATEIAKVLVEYVEGTYVQGVVPGFEYEPPVSDLLSDAQQSDGGPGGTPL